MKHSLKTLGEYGVTVVGSILFGITVLVSIVGSIVRLGGEPERPRT